MSIAAFQEAVQQQIEKEATRVRWCTSRPSNKGARRAPASAHKWSPPRCALTQLGNRWQMLPNVPVRNRLPCEITNKDRPGKKEKDQRRQPKAERNRETTKGVACSLLPHPFNAVSVSRRRNKETEKREKNERRETRGDEENERKRIERKGRLEFTSSTLSK